MIAFGIAVNAIKEEFKKQYFIPTVNIRWLVFFCAKTRLVMVLNVTEEQEKVIESQGYMVVEFKLWYRKLGEMLIDYVRRWIDTWRAIILFLQEEIAKAADALIDFSERLLAEFKPYVEQLEYVNRREHREYEFVRSLCKTYRLNLSKKVIYHRCRDRC